MTTSEATPTRPCTGRPRDAAIDAAVLDATLAQLARDGFAGLSIASVAAAAGTTRPAVYRRWKDKTALVVDAIAHLAQVEPPEVTGEPFVDLVAELEHFRHCITGASSLPVVGLMLGDGLEAPVREQYAAHVVAPRRARLRAILTSAVARGELPETADLLVAGSFLTGSWYALAVSETPPPSDWARRVASLVWRGCGGTVPN